MKAKTREDLDRTARATCEMSECVQPDDPHVLIFSPGCHVESGMHVEYFPHCGEMVLSCNECRTEAIHLQIALGLPVTEGDQN